MVADCTHDQLLCIRGPTAGLNRRLQQDYRRPPISGLCALAILLSDPLPICGTIIVVSAGAENGRRFLSVPLLSVLTSKPLVSAFVVGCPNSHYHIKWYWQEGNRPLGCAALAMFLQPVIKPSLHRDHPTCLMTIGAHEETHATLAARPASARLFLREHESCVSEACIPCIQVEMANPNLRCLKRRQKQANRRYQVLADHFGERFDLS